MSSPIREDRESMSSNPFAAPRVGDTGEPSPRAAHYGDATTGQRFANFIIDYICVQVCSFIAGMVMSLVLGDVSWAWVVGMFTFFGYYTLLEGLTARTVGKLVTGTKIVDDGGNAATIKHALLRSLIRIVPFEAFSFISDGRGWHDEWSHTRVVRLRPNKFEAGIT